jgi:hypothetical protein
MTLNNLLIQAIAIATQNLPIQAAVCKNPSGFVICDLGHRYAVYDGDAWKPQTESFLPWSAPKGVKVAIMDVDGTVRMI